MLHPGVHWRSVTLAALRVRGPFHGPHGYDRHTRAFVRELHQLGIAIQLVDLPEWTSARLPDGSIEPWLDHMDRPVGAKVALELCMPHQVVPVPGMVMVNYTMFEADRIPAAWDAHAPARDRKKE